MVRDNRIYHEKVSGGHKNLGGQLAVVAAITEQSKAGGTATVASW